MSDDGDPTPGEFDDSTADAETTGAEDAQESAGSSTGAADGATESETLDLFAADDLVERVADLDQRIATDVETVLAERDHLAARVQQLEADLTEHEAALDERAKEIEDLQSRVKRKQADFENYKKRRKREEEKIRERATEDLVERLLDVRDNLVRALSEDHEDVEGLREGVKMTLNEFDRVLDAENVHEIDPEPGTQVDPGRHEVMMQVESDQPEDTVADVYQPGYEMADQVLRAAKVTVSEGSAESPDGN